MNYIDISWPITPEMSTYKDRKQVMGLQTKRFAADGVEESCLIMGVHTGTHIDAPAHMLGDGATSETLRPETFCGIARVLDFSDAQISAVTEELLRDHEINSGEIILLKTSNSALADNAPFCKNFVYLDGSGAQYLASKKIKAIGIDYLGIERGQSDYKTHRTLLNAEIGLIEGLRLKDASQKRYTIVCLPIALHGFDGVPARALLIDADKRVLF